MEVSQFREKLNKVDGNVYVIEEMANVTDGIYEAELIHDNINVSTLSVYTGPKLTGEKLQSYAVSTPSLTPWKRVIRVYADVPRVYISYETDGDTVEAEDINKVQEAVILTQKAINSEAVRANAAERELEFDLQAETERAKKSENKNAENISSESNRAENAEKLLREDLAAEILRASAEERTNADRIEKEAERAMGREDRLVETIEAEANRAKEAERVNANNLSGEIVRAREEEKKLADDLTAETERAKNAETVNGDAIATEATRAKKKESELQTGLQNEITRASNTENEIRNTITTNKPKWDDKYTRNEVDNKFAALETAIDWKEAVNTYSDLSSIYPAPDDGWTVNVKDTDYTYRWSGTKWIAISANAIPKATQNVDGLLSKEDKAAIDDAYIKRHTHGNKSTLDKLTETFLSNWTDAYNKRHEHGNKALLDKITQALFDNWNAAFTHTGNKSNPHGVTKAQAGLGNVPNVATNDQTPTFTQGTTLENITSGEKLTAMLGKISKAVADLISHKADSVSHVTASERTAWNDANTKKHTHGNKGVVDKLTQSMLDKLAGIATGAEVNVQADWKATDTASDAYIKNKPTSMPASDVAAWAKAADKPTYGWTEITGKPGSYPPSSHTHTKSQVTDMPTKLSQFTNDSGFLTSADIDTSKNHTHANKTVLDKITQALFDNWNAAFTHSGNKSNPHGVTASQVGAAASSHTHTKNQITDFPSSMPASDVSSWAKAASKPSYGWTEITGKPSTFAPAAHSHTNLAATNITGQTVDVNSYNLSSGSPQIQFYSEKTSGGATNITNIPVTGQPFLLKVESLRWASATDYITKQTFSSATAKTTYERYCTNGTWSAWLPVGRFNATPVSGRVLVSDGTAGGIKSSAYTIAASVPSGAKFTDTVYTHPNSGVTAGSYQSVSVNAQGHVTGGVPQGSFMWSQLKGAYTWGQMGGK